MTKLREVAPINYHLGCGYTRDEDNPTNTLSNHWKHASIWPLLKPLLFWKGDTDELNAKTKGSDRIPAKKEPCLTPTYWMKDKPETLIHPTMDIKWSSGSLP